jgi:hypothetical protein
VLTVLHYTIIGFGSGLCALLVFVGIGCGLRPKATDSADAPPAVREPVAPQPSAPPAPPPKKPAPRKEPPAPPAPAVPDGPVAFDGLTNTLSNDYANNPDRADAQCKGKRVRMKGRIDHVGERDGVLVLGYSSMRDSSRPLEATVVFAFPRGTPAADVGVKPGQIAVIEGTCRGRVEDGAPRASGQTYHVRIDGCKLLGTETEGR